MPVHVRKYSGVARIFSGDHGDPCFTVVCCKFKEFYEISVEACRIILNPCDIRIADVYEQALRLKYRGLLQMDMTDEAMKYIENITIVQKETIDRIMHSSLEPSIAALLIGKAARAAELNVNFVFDEGSVYVRSDCPLPENELITVIGNLIDNALDAMNMAADYSLKELEFGIYSRPGSLLIIVGDTGCGILENNRSHIFEKGFSTKGEGRGTGLYRTWKIVKSLGGSISFTSEDGVGTSFEVSFGGENV